MRRLFWTNQRCSKSLGSPRLWEVKAIFCKCLFYTSVSIPFSGVSKYWQGRYLPAPVSAFCALWRRLGLVVFQGLCWWEMCHFPQIRPSDGGYGFTLEERNRVPIIKSVEKGSPAEVREQSCNQYRCSTVLFWGLAQDKGKSMYIFLG